MSKTIGERELVLGHLAGGDAGQDPGSSGSLESAWQVSVP